MEFQPTINMWTLGHVANGKSSLVQSMTGIQTQNFSKEKERNMTWKLGYANCKIYQCPECPSPDRYQSTNGKSKTLKCKFCGSDMELKKHISFVDCPGHNVLMSTMLNGTAVMDSALFVIAANEEIPKPQTTEHMEAAQAMGLKDFVVCVNKVDLINKSKAKEVHKTIVNFLENSHDKESPLVPVSDT